MPNPKLSTLTDAFTSGSINPTLWNASSGGGVLTLDTVNNRAQIAVGTTASTYYSLGANGPYDATNSGLYARVGAAPNGAGGVQTVMKLAVDASNSIQAQVNSGGVFLLQVQTAGSYVTTTLPAYNPYLHAWWQLAESGGNFTFSTSIDGATWTALATVAHSWSAAALMVFFQTGATDTEPSGQQAWIAHVNTPLGGTLNPAWPAVEHAWGPRWNVNAATVPLDQYVDVSSRTRAQTGIQRGRQYELDQVQSGQMATQWANTGGEFDPGNTSGPWHGHVQPFQPFRLRAQWPPTVNLLTQVQATGGDLGGYPAGLVPTGQSGIGIVSDLDTTGGSIVASGSAWQGGSVFQFAIPASSVSGASACYTAQPAIEPGQPYAQQMQVRNVTAGTSLGVRAYLAWYDASGASISTSTGSSATLTGGASAGWTQITVTGIVPTNAAYVHAGVRLAGASPGSTVSLQVDGWELEKASAPSLWTVPGMWSPIFAGFVDRYPQVWEMGGTYGLVNPTAYDAFAILSQRSLRDPLVEEMYSRSPRYVYTLSDPVNSLQFADATGNCLPAKLAISKDGLGSLTAGVQITAANPATGVYTGSTGTVVTLSNTSPGSASIGAATYISLTPAGIGGPTGTVWTRALAFRYTAATPAVQAALWSGFGPHYQPPGPLVSGAAITAYIDSSGHVNVGIQDATGTGATMIASTVNVCDSNWHLLIFGQQVATGKAFLNLDGTTLVSSSGFPASAPTGLRSDSIGAWPDPSAGNDTIYNTKGDFSFAAEWPSYLSSTDCTAIYSAWRNSFTGDSSDQRYARILSWAGYTGPTSIQAGLTTSMGPAAVAGQDALTALQAVVDTENGAHYVARDGTVTFKARSDRYNKLVPAYVLGERTDLGEIPYEGLAADYDPTRIANQVTITQQSTNQQFFAQDTTSINNNAPRTLTRTVNSTSPEECQAAASYLISRYKTAATRVASLLLHPAANPTLLWPVCLALELGTRIRVMRRPPGLAPISIDCFVESLVWRFDDKNDAFLTLQCSPVDLTPYGLFAAFHTTLSGSPAAGVSTITINAGADNTTPAAAQISCGQQLVLGQNAANQETVTVKSVATTTAGWSTAAITLQAPTTKSHTGGDTVCEPLPAGVTDPTTWDAVAMFDSTIFSY